MGCREVFFFVRPFPIIVALVLSLGWSTETAAYAVLAHEAIIDEMEVEIRQRTLRQLTDFPRVSGAPGEIRTPDPLLRSHSNYFAKSCQRCG